MRVCIKKHMQSSFEQVLIQCYVDRETGNEQYFFEKQILIQCYVDRETGDKQYFFEKQIIN